MKKNASAESAAAVDVEDRALAFRRKGRSFAKIATTLGLESANQAVTAYRGAFRRCTPADQKKLRAAERKRFDAMEKAVRANGELAADEIATRIAKIANLRTALG